MTVAKRQHDEHTAIAVGTERLELLIALKDNEGQMEALADLAHCQATIGEFEAARELFERSLEHASNLGSLSGKLVARWGRPTWRKSSRTTKTPCWFFRNACMNSSLC